jgi:3-hydroxyisobutyrate dehydrogenase-like beta-hydroxyacid dehydrogenase
MARGELICRVMERGDRGMKVGFIGLGNMGSAIARNLIKAGHTLTVYNRTRSRAEPFASLGATIAESPSEAAAGAEVLITMLADDAAVEAVVFAPGNAIQALPAGAGHISMSTISVDLSRQLAKAHSDKQQHYVAAPVFGRPDAAAAGKLFIVAAGPSEQIERCRPLFDAIGQKTFIAGEEPHAANVIKVAGNFLITTVIESLAEAFALGRKFGVEPHTFLDILTNSLFAAPIYRNYGSMIASDTFEPAGFKLPLGFKDNRLLLAAAEEAAVPMPMASLVHDRFVAALALGLADADWAAIARVSYEDAGLRKEVSK